MRILTALAAAAALFAPAPAIAQDPDVVISVKSVEFQDLDLATPTGLRMLDQRIRLATDAVCGTYAQADYYEWNEIGRCRAGVKRGIEPQVAQALDAAKTRYAKR